jgi:hypothetical protein
VCEKFKRQNLKVRDCFGHLDIAGTNDCSKEESVRMWTGTSGGVL